MGARVIGLGQAALGDDGVGIAIVHRVREARSIENLEIFEAHDATALIPLLATRDVVVIVDAVVGDVAAGQLIELDADTLGKNAKGFRPVSTHGMDIERAIALARIVSGADMALQIWIVGVTIAPRMVCGFGLSSAVRAAVPRAALAVLARVRG